jgi:hypothetical protein
MLVRYFKIDIILKKALPHPRRQGALLLSPPGGTSPNWN